MSKVPGFFAAGDVADNVYRQVIHARVLLAPGFRVELRAFLTFLQDGLRVRVAFRLA